MGTERIRAPYDNEFPGVSNTGYRFFQEAARAINSLSFFDGWVDSSVYSSLAVAATEAAGKYLIITPGSYTLSANLTLSASIKGVWIQPGALIDGGYTFTINCPAMIGPYKVFGSSVTVSMSAGVVDCTYVEWWEDGAYPTDHTAAFAKALNCGGSNRTQLLNKTYNITDTVTPTKNRFHLFGGGIGSAVYFNPTANGKTLLFLQSSKDNCLIENVYFYFNNSNSKSSAACIDVTDSCNSIKLNRVTIDSFDEFGFRHDEAMYDSFYECRFVNMDNSSQNDHVAKALHFTTFGNAINIENCRFAQNDMAVHFEAGHGIRIVGCQFEQNGDSGESHISSQVHLENCDGVFFGAGNYIEANRTGTGYAFLRLDNCVAPVVCGNTFNGDLGGTTYTKRFISIDANCHRAVVEGNEFSEVADYFISTSSVVICKNNKYRDGGSDITAYNSIMALMSGNDKIELEDVEYTFTWDPTSIGDGSGTATGKSITGAVMGDKALVSCDGSLGLCLLYAEVVSSGNVTIRILNLTGGTVDVPNSTFRVKIIKAK